MDSQSSPNLESGVEEQNLFRTRGLTATFLAGNGSYLFSLSSTVSGTGIKVSDGRHIETLLLPIDPDAALRMLAMIVQPYGANRAVLNVQPRAILGSYSDALLAIFLQHHCNCLELADGSIQGDVVLAHAIPLDSSTRIWASILRNFTEIISCSQLTLLARTDFVLVDPSRIAPERVAWLHRRVLRTNGDLTKKRSQSTANALKRWPYFTELRFGERPSNSTERLLISLFSGQGFSTLEYYKDDDWICSSLVYRDEERGILFDVLAPWNMEHTKRRPGFYSAVKNLLCAQQERLRYSLCYGRFPYKDSIIREIPEVML